MTSTAKMGWNPDSPTNELRVSLLAYLRARLHRLDDATSSGSPPVAAEIASLRRWIAWLEGGEVAL